jgi:hypothetical protein
MTLFDEVPTPKLNELISALPDKLKETPEHNRTPGNPRFMGFIVLHFMKADPEGKIGLPQVNDEWEIIMQSFENSCVHYDHMEDLFEIDELAIEHLRSSPSGEDIHNKLVDGDYLMCSLAGKVEFGSRTDHEGATEYHSDVRIEWAHFSILLKHERDAFDAMTAEEKELLKVLETLPSPPPAGERYKHVNGYTYEIIGAAREDHHESSEEAVIVMRGEHDGRLWYRSRANFHGKHESGAQRFTLIVGGPKLPTTAEMQTAFNAAISFALHADEGLEFLRCWQEGAVGAIKREWPDCPAEALVGLGEIDEDRLPKMKPVATKKD